MVIWKRSPVSDISIVRTLCALKPGSTLRKAMKVRISRAAPISRTIASETSVTTSKERTLLWRNPVPERLLLSLSVVLRSGREAPMAGNNPKRIPVSKETPTVKARTRQSMPTEAPLEALTRSHFTALRRRLEFNHRGLHRNGKDEEQSQRRVWKPDVRIG